MSITDQDCYRLVSMDLIYPTTENMPETKMKDYSTATTTINEYVLM